MNSTSAAEIPSHDEERITHIVGMVVTISPDRMKDACEDTCGQVGAVRTELELETATTVV